MILSAIRSGQLRYGDRLDLEDVEIRAYPGTAVLVGVLRIHVLSPGGEILARNRFTMHWSLGPHGWQLVSWQSTAMKE